MKELYGKKYYGPDYMELAKNLLGHNEKLVQVHYFTAYFTQDHEGERKHRDCVSILSYRGVRIIFGKFQKVSKMYLKTKNKVMHMMRENLIKLLPNSIKSRYCLPIYAIRLERKRELM
ncbi:MAG: hypothetical protein LBG52_01400 [Candidatus Peribacteria bacterium]|jgi:hypothetical protein|nr:hypothetical protein [Candidatus Peribacteria bacterium]